MKEYKCFVALELVVTEKMAQGFMLACLLVCRIVFTVIIPLVKSGNRLSFCEFGKRSNLGVVD